MTKLTSFAPRLLNTVDRCGRTPLHIACLNGHTKIVRKLLENGAALTKYSTSIDILTKDVVDLNKCNAIYTEIVINAQHSTMLLGMGQLTA